MLRRTVVILLLAVLYFPVLAQKVKYKELIELLKVREFEKAEPFLKRYIKETPDNPNAFLYMGIIYQDKQGRIDPLMHTGVLTLTIDSSLLFLDKAFKTITEKEVKKNDEYYEAYTKRDLRTGKFGIKLSDVQLDIETRAKTLKERKDNIIKLKQHFVAAVSKYERANKLYKDLHEKYGSEREFFLRSDDDMANTLKSITAAFDSMNVAFDQYKTVNKAMGKTGYNQVIDLLEIKDFKRDGSSIADFMKDDLKLWDYKRWANQSIETIEKEIKPMRNNLVAYDIEINKLRDKLKTDSMSVKSDLAKLINKMLSDQMRKYDPDPMPLDVFEMKMAELEYTSNVIIARPLRDSANLTLKLKAIKDEIGDLVKIDSLASNLSKRDFAVEEKDYNHFISKAYGTVSVLKSLISTTGEFAKREQAKRQAEWDKISQSLNWLVAGSDSIPLTMETKRELPFKPLVIEKEKFTFGLTYQDSVATGYFYTITSSRVPDVKASFPVDKVNFKKKFLPLIKGLSTTDGSGHIYFCLVLSTQKMDNKFPVTISKIYHSDGLAWSADFSFDLIPSEITYNSDSGELSVRLTALDGSNKMVLIDKNGKLIQ